jgi:hypothetical protein
MTSWTVFIPFCRSKASWKPGCKGHSRCSTHLLAWLTCLPGALCATQAMQPSLLPCTPHSLPVSPCCPPPACFAACSQTVCTSGLVLLAWTAWHTCECSCCSCKPVLCAADSDSYTSSRYSCWARSQIRSAFPSHTPNLSNKQDENRYSSGFEWLPCHDTGW